MPHVPTTEQATVIEAARTVPDNILIRALAGAAKTSTLIMIAEALKPTTMLCLAFNKAIAMEMTERLPSNCTAQTLNSLGHRTWAEATGKRLVLDDAKCYKLLTAAVKRLGGLEQQLAYTEFADMLEAIKLGKTCGYIPTGAFPHGQGLMNDEEFFAQLDEIPSASAERLIRLVTTQSIQQAFDGTIDFNDQIFMPTLFPALFTSYPVTLVDEAQDLSAINHKMLKKLVRKNRIIAVGDENQAIYGFRGAHHDSMDLLRKTFSMKEFRLSITFRCAQRIVKEALWKAPHMLWRDGAPEGEVKILGDWGPELFDSLTNFAIICRNNAPLFSMAIKLLKAGRYPQLRGNDIGKYLVKVMKKLGPLTMSREEAFAALAAWELDKQKKNRNHEKLRDQVVCIEVFLAQGETLSDAIAYAEYLFLVSGPIQMMTGHKAKGLEFDEVFILDRHLIRPSDDARNQEKNLLYVCQTRARTKLTYLDTLNYTAGSTMAPSRRAMPIS